MRTFFCTQKVTVSSRFFRCSRPSQSSQSFEVQATPVQFGGVIVPSNMLHEGRVFGGEPSTFVNSARRSLLALHRVGGQAFGSRVRRKCDRVSRLLSRISVVTTTWWQSSPSSTTFDLLLDLKLGTGSESINASQLGLLVVVS